MKYEEIIERNIWKELIRFNILQYAMHTWIHMFTLPLKFL